MDFFAESQGVDREREAQRRQRLEDLAAVAATVEGERVLAALLSSQGMGRQISERDLHSHNQAIGLMDMIVKARPKTALNILGMIYGILQPQEKL